MKSSRHFEWSSAFFLTTMKKICIGIITIFGFTVVSILCSALQKPGWVERLNYTSDEIYPITLTLNNIPLVTVIINETPLDIFFDTGNSHGLGLTTAIEGKIAYKVIKTIRSTWPDGSYRGESKIITISSLDVFGDAYNNVEAVFSDWKMYSSLKFNGLLGLKFFRNKRVTLDYKNKKIAVSVIPLPDVALQNSHDVAVTLLNPPERHRDLIYLRGKVNGQETVIYLDTGSSASFIDPRMLDKNDIIKENKRSIVKDIKFSINGFDFIVSRMRVRELRRGMNFKYPVSARLGSDVLKGFLITIDKITNRIIFHKD
jgi:hypothetical protein